MITYPRRVQKLGTSSLVIALPKEWVKKHKIDKGQVLYVIEDGPSLKIVMPSETESGKPPVLKVDILEDPNMVPLTVNCLYVLGYDDYIIDLNNQPPEVQLALKKQASKLTGLELSNIDRNRLRAQNVMNLDNIDPKTTVKSLGISLSQIFELLAMGVKGNGDSFDLMRELRTEIFRLQHLIVKYLASKNRVIGEDGETYSLLLGTSLMGIIAEDSYLIAEVLKSRNEKAGERVIEKMNKLSEIIPRIIMNVVEPNLGTSMKLINEIKSIHNDLIEELKRTNNVVDAIISQYLANISVIVWIVSIISLCVSLSKEIMSK